MGDEEGRAAIEAAAPLRLVEDVKIKATPFVWRAPSEIPRRRHLYGFELSRGHLSAVVAPGAAGKTTFKVGRALCMATGREHLGHRVWQGPHRVWLWNLEDDMEEVERLIHAFCKLWDIGPADFDGRLFVDSALDGAILKLAVEGQGGGYEIKRPTVVALIDELKARGIDYLDVDPFVSSHAVNENDNGAIDAVSKEWAQVAHEANAAICLAHHIRKPNGADATVNDARGASALVNTCRSVLTINRMTEDQAVLFTIPPCDARRYIRVFDDKNNRAPPPPTNSEWYEITGVDLGNGDEDGPPDNVGAVRRWQAPDAFGGVTKAEMIAIQKAVEKADKDVVNGRVRKNPQATRWVGNLVIQILGLNRDSPADLARVKEMCRVWLANGFLRSEPGKTAKGDPTDFVLVGNVVEAE